MTDLSMTDAAAASAPPEFTGYHHLSITVRDMERSEAWYRDVLGLVRDFVQPHAWDTGYAVVLTRPGLSFMLALEHHDSAGLSVFTPTRIGLDHIAFGVKTRAELDAWVAHLDAHGVLRDPIVEEPEKSLSRVSFRDPDGIPLELICHRPASD